MKESIRESMIYGKFIQNTNMSKEYIQETYFDNKIELLDEQVEVINEMHFSKKDLQDPRTIDKILKGKEIFESAIEWLYVLFILLTLAGSLTLGVIVSPLLGIIGLPVLALIFTNIGIALNAVPAKWYEKNSEKYEKQVKDLLEKTKDKLKTNPKNKEKLEAIVKGCENVLKVIEENKKKAEELAKQYQYKYYSNVVKWLEKPFCFGHTGDYKDAEPFRSFNEFTWVCKYLKIPEKALYDTLAKHKNVLYTVQVYGEARRTNSGKVYNAEDEIRGWLSFDDEYYIDYDIEKLKKDLGKFIYYVQSDDEYAIYYTETGKFIECDDSGKPYKFITPYSIADDGNLPKNIEDILIEADKELGYYRLSKCPEQVKKKKFPV